MNRGKIFFRLVVIVSLGLFCAGCKTGASSNQVCFKTTCFDVELAVTSEERKKGLQFRETLAESEGMLFVFANQERRRFWMKDTLIPLDIIWLDYARRVVHIEHHVPPCKADPCDVYTPKRPGLYVLELAAGQAVQMGLRLNDKMIFKLKNTK